ncbi:MAG: uroporphyrinogen-III synthase [Hydrogenophaga sp.]|nr:uroporphyrinogen-III synthase [Hydrogenophaga sp.]
MGGDQERARLSHLIVTRPEPEASQWAGALCRQGWPAAALPLIHIGEPASAAALQALIGWRQRLAELDAAMFVSGAAVAHFFAGVPSTDFTVSRTRFWAPGPATAAALRAAGVPADRVDAPPDEAPQFDSEHLWPIVAGQLRPGARVLIVRGASLDAPVQALAGNGREWLIAQCEAAGARVEACVAYERRPPLWSVEQTALARTARGTRAAWLFSSSEALQHLRQWSPQTDWHGTAALATHPRIAESARLAGFAPVVTTRPGLPDVMRALESTWSPA